ncbi:MAG: DCC1-like thiol-disulfide oxidoreductase family protein [Parasphingorhabdus sp.]|uniref:thiol-disulfide oxidoreductase DCC family protein n=1 Tax=Parasphingorhabdus sp. TaxID=2709688 RepID=UPI003297DD15
MSYPHDISALPPGKSIIVFDAVCILCSANAQFILKHDQRQQFLLAPMQGKYGSRLYRKYGIDPSEPETLIVVQNGQLLRNSDAILAIYDGLGWPWKIANMALIIPAFLRDRLYLFVARNRYRIFGKRETCWVPQAADKDRIL